MVTLGLNEPKRPIAVTSLDPKDWKEDPAEAAARNGLGYRLKQDDPDGNAAILRGFYPLRAQLLKFDGVLGFQKGVVLKYARVKRTPERFPIEVFFSGPTGNGQHRMIKVNYDSEDVALLEP